jgi:hypothetical protein
MTTTTTTTGGGPPEEAPEEEAHHAAASPKKLPLSMEEYVEEYLVVPIRKRACSTIIVVPCLAISTALVLMMGRYYHFILECILVPAVHLLLRILGIAVGIGLGLGLATHVHDTLDVRATNSRYAPVCQLDNSTATITDQKYKSQCFFAYFSLQTTMRDTSLSLLSFYHLPFTVG